MPNYERYNKLHDEVMKRLEDGEITTEQAKEVNDKFFDRYVAEAPSSSIQDKIQKLRLDFETTTHSLLIVLKDLSPKMDSTEKDEYNKLKIRYNEFSKKLIKIEFNNYDEFLKEYNQLHSDMGKLAISLRDKK